MTDTNQKGVAHRHPRPMPSRRRMDELLRSPTVPKIEFILPDHNTFGHLDLRWTGQMRVRSGRTRNEFLDNFSLS